MKIPMNDTHGNPRGEIEIPDEIIKMAHIVSAYLSNNTNIASLCGLFLKVGTVNVEIKI